MKRPIPLETKIAIAKQFRAGGITQAGLARVWNTTPVTIRSILGRMGITPFVTSCCPHCGGEIASHHGRRVRQEMRDAKEIMRGTGMMTAARTAESEDV